MNRHEFDHAVRAAASIIGVAEVLVIGSQAIHGSAAGDVPVEALRSVEVDIAVFDDPDASRADLIDGSIGEASMFHETFGFYAQGVSETTAILPAGWRARLVRYESPATNGVVAWCLEPHDLWISKAVAGRPKDHEFCMALLRDESVDPAVLEERLAVAPGLAEPVRARLLKWINGSSGSRPD